jgi:subtilisin family serine protease
MPHARAFAVAAVCLLVALARGAVSPAPAVPASADGRYIVVLRPDVDDPRTTAEDLGRTHGFQVTHVYTSALKGFAASMPDRVAARLARHPRVALIDADLPVAAVAQSVPTGVRRIGADRNPTAKIDGADGRVPVDVAVLDTGVNAGHPDLNVVGGKDCTGTGSYADNHGHGTHVAGTIGALDNGIGVVGVAPGARIWAVKVLNSSGSGSWSTIICGIDWVTAHSGTIAVANMSLSGTGTDGTCGSSSLHQAICNSVNAGVTYVVAAGNEHKNASSSVPATYAEVITVSALADSDGKPGRLGGATAYGPDDSLASFSNYGGDIDLAAPGVGVVSTSASGGYTTMNGTSMASPHVAGAAALYVAVNGRVGPASVKSALLASREKVALAGDPDGAAEGVLWVGSGGAPTTPTPTPTRTPSPTATRTATGTPTVAPTVPPVLGGSKLTIVANSVSAASTGAYAYDGRTATSWYVSGASLSSAWIRFDLGATRSLTGVRWLFYRTGYADAFEIQVSTDGTAWTTVASLGNSAANVWQTLATTASARYVRFFVRNPNGDTRLGYLAEVEIWGSTSTAGVADTAANPPTPTVPPAAPATEPPTPTQEPASPTPTAAPTETPQPTETPTPTPLPPTATPEPPAPTATPVPTEPAAADSSDAPTVPSGESDAPSG